MTETAIYVDDLRKKYGSGDEMVQAVDGVSFEIEQGSVVGLLGPNGAGKTTTIKSLLGLILPDSGTVEIFGNDVYEHPTRVYENVGAMLEGARNVYWRLTVRENLVYFAGLGGEDANDIESRHDALLSQFDLEEWADTPVRDLSRGMKQKVSMVSTLARDVDLVFLDEPTLGLDVEASAELRSELRDFSERDDATIVLSSHDMDVIEAVCDRVLIFNDGSVVVYDDLESLLDVFHTREYLISVQSQLPDAVREGLDPIVDVEVTNSKYGSEISLVANQSSDIYDIMSVLNRHETELRGIQSVEPDLEDVFLQLTSGNSDRIDRSGEVDLQEESNSTEPAEKMTKTVENDVDGNN